MSTTIDPVALSALLASRVCHDLINPVGALGSGLDVLDETDQDAAMKDAALDLIRSGGQKAIAVLKFARLAYGSAGGFGAQIPMEEAELCLKDLYKWAKADLDWRISPGMRSKEAVKIALILGSFAADCVPRGGKVTVSEELQTIIVAAEGPRALLNEDLVAALQGRATELKPKFAPAFIAGELARAMGGETSAEIEGHRVTLRARLAESRLRAAC